MTIKELREELKKTNDDISEGEYSVKTILHEIESAKIEMKQDVEERRQYRIGNITDLQKNLVKAKTEEQKKVIKNFIRENENELQKEIDKILNSPTTQFIAKAQGSLQSDQKILEELKCKRQKLICEIRTISPNETIPEPKKYNPKDHFQVKRQKYSVGSYIGVIAFYGIIILIILKACGKI